MTEDQENEGDVDPFAPPADPNAPDADPDAEADLGALASGSRHSLPKGVGDESKLDLAAFSRAPAPIQSQPPPAAVQSSIAPAGPALETDSEPEWSPRRRTLPAWALPWAVGFGLGLGAGFAAGAVFFLGARVETALPSMSPALPSVVVAPSSPIAVGAPAAAPSATLPVAPSTPATVGEQAPAVATVAPGAEPGIERGAGQERHPSRSDSDRSVTADSAPVAAVENAAPALTLRPALESPPPPAPTSGAEGAPPQGMDRLLDEALSPAARQAALKSERERAQSAAELPLQPAREDVEAAVAVLRPAIRGCAMGQAGLATADIVVRSDGSVAGVRVSGAPFAGAASGRCMEGVVRRARFPRFRKPSFQIRYPFSIQ